MNIVPNLAATQGRTLKKIMDWLKIKINTTFLIFYQRDQNEMEKMSWGDEHKPQL